MTDTLYNSTTSAILDNYADVIEGGNTYLGSGSGHVGIAGTQSYLRAPDLYAQTSSGGQSGTTLTISLYDEDFVVDISDAASEHILRTTAPPIYIYADQSNVGGGSHTNDNDKRARKITACTDGATASITIQSAFADTITGTPVFRFREGFKRMPDNIDINSDDTEIPSGFDRYFHLSLLPGRRLGWYGKGIETYEGTLQVRLRLLKHARAQTAAASALENLMRFRSVITAPGSRDVDSSNTSYTQAVFAEDSEAKIENEDQHKVVALDEYRIIYRFTSLHD